MGFYKHATDNTETSIENLYVEGFIYKLTALKLKEHTNCQNLDGIKIRMEQVDDFEVELDTVKCQEELDRHMNDERYKKNPTSERLVTLIEKEPYSPPRSSKPKGMKDFFK